MKNILSLILIFILPAFIVAQGLDQPVAIVKLYKTSVISQKTFRDQVQVYESSTGRKLTDQDKDKLLDTMILGELVSQAAEKQGIRTSDDDIFKQVRQSNPNVTDQQIKAGIEQQTGMPWEKASATIKRQLTSQKYLTMNPKFAELSKIDVSEKEISDFYEANKASFVSPDFVRVSHIYFDTTANPRGTIDEIKTRAQNVWSTINSGKATFEEMAFKESDDKISNKLNGDIGFIPKTFEGQIGQQLISRFGKPLLDEMFALKAGTVSKVIMGVTGLHIIKVTQKIDHHFQTLDEAYYPGKDPKVKDVIKQSLGQRKIAAEQEKIIDQIGEDLKKDADIKLYRNNM